MFFLKGEEGKLKSWKEIKGMRENNGGQKESRRKGDNRDG